MSDLDRKASLQATHSRGSTASIRRGTAKKIILEKRKICDTSLYIFKKDNPLRLLCLRIIVHDAFSFIVLSLIIGNCIFLALTEPFATCCSDSDLSDSAIVKVDITNYTVNCNMYNELVNSNLELLGEKCCIDQSQLVGDPFNLCASASLRKQQETAELIFNILFTIEMMIKIIALGFVRNQGTYLRDAWNMLDFVVVTVGWLSYVPGIANLSALRTFRVLRPLRTLSSIPGMRPIVTAMIACIRSMVHVLMLCVFLFTVFGIVGLQLFSGSLKGRCHVVDPSASMNPSYESQYSLAGLYPEFSFMMVNEADGAPCPLPCGEPGDDGSVIRSAWSRWTHSPDDCLGLGGPICQGRGKTIFPNPFYDPNSNDTIQHTVSMPTQLTSALATDDPSYKFTNGTFTQIYDKSKPYVEIVSFCFDTGENQLGSGFANFDNIGYSWLTIFTSITLEGWVDVMYGIQASFGHGFLVFMYFFIMVWLCSFFMLELTLAVINDAYDQAAEEEEERMRQALEEALAEELAEHVAGTEEAQENNAEALENYQERKQNKKVLKPWGPKLCKTCFWLVETNMWTGFVTLLIILNTVTLAMERHNMGQETKDFLDSTNLFFTVAFTIEMVMKMIGLGLRQYCWDSFNIFDFIVVTISIVELGMNNEDGGSGLSALRSFRLMRVFKLARSWKNLRKLLSTILLSILDVTNAAILLVIIMFIFTLLGMQLFGGQWTANYFCEDETNYEECLVETPRANFDSFWWGFVTVFQVLTGENWNEVMYIGKKVSKDIAVVYFVFLNIIGNYMVLNLFLAILLARFDNPEEEDEEEDIAGKSIEGDDGSSSAPGAQSAVVAPMPAEEAVIHKTTSAGSLLEEEDFTDPNKAIMNPHARAFFIFPPDMPLRQQTFSLINSSRFDNFILFLIFISTILLAVEEPWIDECKLTTCKGLGDFLKYMDLILNVFFIAEMLLKMFSLGIVLHPYSYLRNGWNILDFIIVIISISAIVLDGGAFKALKSLRSLRALRPLRVISRSPGMRLVVSAIIAAVPAIANVTVVVILFMLIFAIIGVQNFMGGLNSCNDPGVGGPTMFDCVGYNSTMLPGADFVGLTWFPSGETCSMLPTAALVEICLKNGTAGCQSCIDGGGFPRVWAPNGGYANSYNFDDVGQALLVVFEVVSGEMWPDIMYSTMDITGPDLPMLNWPHRQNTTVAWWYILVTLICAFLMINVFVGVIIDNFNQMKDAQNGSGLLTDDQKLWIETMKKTMTQKPIKKMDKPKNKLRGRVWEFIHTTAFEFFIMGVILLNTFMMMLQSDSMSKGLKSFTESMNMMFLVLFTFEFLLKFYGMGLQYFKVKWNMFDFSLVIFGYLGMIGGLGPLASLLRIFRVARIFRLVRTSQGLLTIFRTLVYSIPSMVNVGGIFCLLMLIYSILGMNLFSKIKFGELLNEDANFQGFFVSVATLFRVSTGESFNGIMHDCMIQPPYCSNEEGNCGYPVFAPIYFTSYFLLSAYTLLSMITAIILDNFNDNTAMSNNCITEEHIECFKEQWALLDPKGTMFISEELLVKLVQNVDYPLGVKNTPDNVAKGNTRRKLANKLIQKIDVPSIQGTVAFNDVLTELTSKAMPDVEIPEENAMILKMKGEKNLKQSRLMTKMGTSKDAILYNAGQVNAIMLIQSAMRGFVQRRKLEELSAAINLKMDKNETLPANEAASTTTTTAEENTEVEATDMEDGPEKVNELINEVENMSVEAASPADSAADQSTTNEDKPTPDTPIQEEPEPSDPAAQTATVTPSRSTPELEK